MCWFRKRRRHHRRHPRYETRAQWELRRGREKLAIDRKCEKGGVPVPVQMPPSKPATVTCELKPADALKPKLVEAKSEPLSLSDTQDASPVIKDGALHAAGRADSTRTALENTVYLSAAVGPLTRTQL